MVSNRKRMRRMALNTSLSFKLVHRQGRPPLSPSVYSLASLARLCPLPRLLARLPRLGPSRMALVLGMALAFLASLALA